ncbi:MAG: cell division protein FtsZ [Alphaproteobacteria bacterium]|nr:cell division protein FtsZ [Alphaproteobacteria bacterium]
MIQITVPEMQTQLRPRITVFGVGGAGGNAVNNMIRSNLEGVEFVVANSDAQALSSNLSERKLQLGVNLTRGLGAGAKPDVGRASAEEQIDEINAYLEGTNMAFITAGMGGGTGTGAAPVIARAAREHGILTVGVVTKPFHFEGSHRMRMAEAGIAELQQYVDTLIIIPNQNLFRIANEKTTFADAFRMADEVLHSGVRGVTDLMVMPGLINLDFADIRSVMSEMGKAMMGTGEATGDKRSVNAAEAAIANPLLDDVSMKGARGVLINITGGYDMTLFEVDEAANRIREEVDPDANIIFGSTFEEKMDGRMRVSVVATGIDTAAEMPRSQAVGMAGLNTSKFRAPEAPQQASFNSGFTAPIAAQQQAQKVQPQQQASFYNPAPQQQQQQAPAAPQPSFSSPFTWGAPKQPQQQTVTSQSAALDQLLERAKQAESIMNQATAAEQQQAPQPVQPPASISFGQSQPQFPQAQQPQQQAAFVQPNEKQNTKRSSSLFARIAEFGGKRDVPAAPAEQTSQSPAKELGVNASDRPRLSSEEETLEIPAFLRRQSN